MKLDTKPIDGKARSTAGITIQDNTIEIFYTSKTLSYNKNINYRW
jgi:hypothetical protein